MWSCACGILLAKAWVGTAVSGRVPYILYDGLEPICTQMPCLKREIGINSSVTVLKLKLDLPWFKKKSQGVLCLPFAFLWQLLLWNKLYCSVRAWYEDWFSISLSQNLKKNLVLQTYKRQPTVRSVRHEEFGRANYIVHLSISFQLCRRWDMTQCLVRNNRFFCAMFLWEDTVFRCDLIYRVQRQISARWFPNFLMTISSPSVKTDISRGECSLSRFHHYCVF